MKKLTTSLVLLVAWAGSALGHTLPDEEGVVLQLDHQLFGGHHLPLTILFVAIGVTAWRRWRRSG